MPIEEAIGVAMIVIACLAPVIIVAVIYYLKKRLEHKQILAAIEKGAPLSDLVSVRPAPAGPAWIGYVSKGVAGFIIALGLWAGVHDMRLLAYVIGGVAVAWIVSGLLHRKYYMKGEINGNGGSEAKPAG
jgi:riboflavin transporter FmnP